ncbi:hypothetical protein BJX62DRAFT_243733 [Aspergillus germanicus]
MTSRPSDARGFTVAIISTLGMGLNAIEGTFDEIWDNGNDRVEYNTASGAGNSYAFGEINNHHVVLAYMPGMGKAHGAAGRKQRAFAPAFPTSDSHCWLGSVAVSRYRDIFLGEIQSFLQQLQSYLQQHHTTMNHSVCSSSTICDVAPHQPGEQLQCSPDALVTRTPAYAETSAPQIHFGRFTLGDQVTKSGISRDLISKANDMGSEMEGAGTWDIMPTIIIKDVCDHTDSYKNKKWQRFASVAVAAYAKAGL